MPTPYAFVTSNTYSSGATQEVFTMPAFSSLGCTILIAFVDNAWPGTGFSQIGALTDNLGNNWILLGSSPITTSGSTAYPNIYYTTITLGMQVSASHIISIDYGSSTSWSPGITVVGFSGSVPISPSPSISQSVNSGTTFTFGGNNAAGSLTVLNLGNWSSPTLSGTNSGSYTPITPAVGGMINSTWYTLSTLTGSSVKATWTGSNAYSGEIFSLTPGTANNYSMVFLETYTLVETYTPSGLPASLWHLSPNWPNAPLTGNLLSNVSAKTTGNTATTPSFDSTGATLLVLTYSSLATASFPTTGTIVTDSAGNTWTYGISVNQGSGSQVGIWYTTGNLGVLVTSTTHTVTFTPGASGNFNFSFQVLAFTGSIAASGFVDSTYTNTTAASTSLVCSNFTPNNPQALVVTVFGENATSGSGSFTGGVAHQATAQATTYSQRQSVIQSGSSYPNNFTFYLVDRTAFSASTTAVWTGSFVASTVSIAFRTGNYALVFSDTLTLTDTISTFPPSWIFKTSVHVSSASQSSITTGSFNSTGAALLVLTYNSGNAGTGIPITAGTVTDNQGNLWQLATQVSGGTTPQCGIWYTTGPSGTPTVLNTSATHTVTFNTPGNSNFVVTAFAGAIQTGNIVQNAASGGGTSVGSQVLTPGATPTSPYSLVYLNLGLGTVAATASLSGGTYTQQTVVAGNQGSYPEIYNWYWSQNFIPQPPTTTATFSQSSTESWNAVTFLSGYAPKAQSFTDVFTITDSFSALGTHSKSLSDTISLTESFKKADSKLMTLEDFTQNSTENNLKAANLHLVDAFTILDSVAKAEYRSLTDTKLVTDSVTKNDAPNNFIETFTLVETFDKLATRNEALSDTLTVLESLAKAASKRASDSTSIVETILKLSVRSYADIYTILESLTDFASHNLFATDTFTLLEALNGFTTGKNFSDPFAVLEVLSKATSTSRAEVFSLSDVALETFAHVLNPSDPVPLTEFFSMVVHHPYVLNLNDTFTLADTFSTARSGSTSLFDLIFINDLGFTYSVVYPHYYVNVSDVFTLVDFPFTYVYYAVKIFLEPLPLAEFIHFIGAIKYIISFNDAIILIEFFTKVHPLFLTLPLDTITLNSSIVRFYTPYIVYGIQSLLYGNLRFFTGYNSAPVAVILPQAVTGNRGSIITFSATSSHDANLDAVTFTWNIDPLGSPGIVFNGPVGSAVATVINNSTDPAAQVYTITVSATDNIPGHTPTTASATLTYPLVVPPVIVGGTQTGPRNSAILIMSNATLSPYALPTYSWTQTGGTPVMDTTPTNEANLGINTAGALIGGETLTFTLTVNDGFNPPVSGNYTVVVPQR